MKKLIALVLALSCALHCAPAARALHPQQPKLPQQNPQPTLQLTPQQSNTPK